MKDIDSSLSFGFFLRSRDDLNAFVHKIREENKIHEEWFISVQDKYEEPLRSSICISEKDDFEMLRLSEKK
jgi:hypothetical protein